MNYDSLLELVKKRRSIQRFKPDPIPDEYVDKIIEAARWAPSGGNSQPWEFVVVRKPELREKLVKIIEESVSMTYRMELTRDPEMRFPVFRQPPRTPPPFATVPVFIVVCGDPRTKNSYPVSANLTHADSIFASGLASAFLYMHLAAAALGLGSKWLTLSSHPLEQCLIKQLLGIPLELEIYDTMLVGYPDFEPRSRLVRARKEMVHYDQFDKTRFRTDQQIKDFISAVYRAGV